MQAPLLESKAKAKLPQPVAAPKAGFTARSAKKLHCFDVFHLNQADPEPKSGAKKRKKAEDTEDEKDDKKADKKAERKADKKAA